MVRGDSFISNRHSEMLHANYAGDKFILAVDGDHNEVRPPSMHVFVRRFLQRYMQVPSSWALETRESIFSTLPPWHSTHGRPILETHSSSSAPRRSATAVQAHAKAQHAAHAAQTLDADRDDAALSNGEQEVGMGRAMVANVQNDIANLFDTATNGAVR